MRLGPRSLRMTASGRSRDKSNRIGWGTQFLCLFEKIDFGEQGCSFVFEECALRDEVFLGIFAGFELEVEIAQVFVWLLLALEEVVETGLLAVERRRRSRARRCRQRAQG